MKTLFLENEFEYTGKELRPGFIYEKGLVGSALISWKGSCYVPTKNLVDLEDKQKGSFIKAKKMVHFLGEFFHRDIFFGICMQRILAEIVIDVLEESKTKAKRKGDDIYIENKKLNVSIATVSKISALIHFAVNMDSEGAPVEAIGLKDLNIDSTKFATCVLQKFKQEFESIEQASVKVLEV